MAKITGQRTAEEIATRSPHGSDEVIRLLAALIATGMLEPVPVVTPATEVDLLPDGFPDEQPVRRRLRVGWILIIAAAIGVVAVVAAILIARVLASGSTRPQSSWGVVVDMGCEPQDLQRVLRKANQQPQTLRAVKASARPDEAVLAAGVGPFHLPGGGHRGHRLDPVEPP